MANSILGKVRSLFTHDKKAAAQLEALEAAKDPDMGELKALAELVDKRLDGGPDLATELDKLVARARKDPELRPLLSQEGLVAGAGSKVITQTATGDGNIQVGQAAANSTISFTEAPTSLPPASTRLTTFSTVMTATACSLVRVPRCPRRWHRL